MRKDNKNEQIVEGRLYEFDLSKKTVKNEKSRNYGIEFINGSVSIATNEDGTNVLKVHYTFEPPVNSKSQTTNNKFSALVRIMESGKTWLKDGKEAATKIRIVGSLGLNDFYPNGGDELRSQKIIKGGFIDFLNDFKSPQGINRQKFTVDTVISSADFVQADPEKGTENYVKLDCKLFDFRNAILPYTLIAKSPEAMDYFVKLQYPVYTRVWGENINSTITKEQKTESAFGGTIVDYVPVNHRELIITGASPTTYVYDKTNTLSGENVITEAEIEKVMADRNIYLETVKASSKAYYDSKKAQSNVSSAFNASTTMAVPEGDFASYFG